MDVLGGPPREDDALSAVLRSVQVRSTLYCRSELLCGGLSIEGTGGPSTPGRWRIVYDLVTDSPAGTAPVAEWFRVRDGKVAAVRVFFDARPFAAMMGR